MIISAQRKRPEFSKLKNMQAVDIYTSKEGDIEHGKKGNKGSKGVKVVAYIAYVFCGYVNLNI